MVHRVHAGQGFDDSHLVGELAETVIDARQRRTKPFRLTVKDAHGMSVRQQLVDHMRSDETAAADHENLH